MSSQKNQASDERFLRVQRDPRFREMPERERKIKIDKRFKSMFHDRRFKVTYTVDKRGRPINHTSTDDLKRFYQLSDSEVEEEEEDAKAAADGKKSKAKEKLLKAETQSRSDEEEDVDLRRSEEEDAADDDAEDGGDESALDSDSDSGPDLARGKGNVETSSDEDDDDDVEAVLRQEEEQIEHDWGELSKDAPRSEEVSSRLAVCNMDWQRIKAVDLLALFRSFTPEGGAVLSVKIYPSEFGRERLKMEETQGPLELKALPDDSEDDTEEERVHREKLRDYQFKRLKYYYAVVECDSVHTATKIYEDCDGYEYETSCSMLDLRFIPEEATFEEEPKDAASDVSLSGYTPNLFTSAACATSKAKLTWDETDHERVTALNRKFNKDELLQMDFNAYLASSSDEEEDDDAADGKQTGDAVEQEVKTKKSEEKISKYRELLRGIQDKDERQEDTDMEVTWVPGLKEATEQLVKKKLRGTDKLTPWEEYLQKKREKKKLKKSQRKLRTGEDELSDDELPPDVDLSDPFFSEELGPALKTKRKKTRAEEERTAEEDEELERQKAEMVLLMDDDADEAKHKHFNYDKIVEQQNLSKKKRKKLLKKGEEPLDDGFQVDVKDPRFQAMFTSHLYNLDPSHPSYKRTKATETILAEKQRRRQAEPVGSKQEAAGSKQNDGASATKKPMEPSLSLLVRSVKSKTGQFQARNKRKLVQLETD